MNGKCFNFPDSLFIGSQVNIYLPKHCKASACIKCF